MMGKHHEQNAIRRYLLNQLSDSEQQTVELRLLSDEGFSEELEFVEDELIDEYIASELSETERLNFEETFLAHPERKRKLEAGQALKRYLDAIPPPAPRPTGGINSLRKWVNQLFFSSPVGVVVTALLIAVIGLGIWRGIIYQSDLEKGLIALNKAYSEQRPTEARVSNLKYARFITPRRNEPKPVNEIELRRADRFLNDAFDRSAESYHAMGKLFLLQGNPDKAIEYFEEARKADPNNPRIYADLGAAFFEKGKQEPESSTTNDQRNGKDFETFGRSVEYLNQALELDPNLLEALFNRALVHQHQKLFNLAKSDWRAYLEKDSSSQWALEAQKNLKDLEEQKELGSQNSDKPLDLFMAAYRARDDDAAWKIYRGNYAPAGNVVTTAIIQDILTNNLNPKSTESWKALSYLGELEMRQAQDSYTSDLAKVYATASTHDLTLLEQARQQMVEGYNLLGESRIAEANKFFDSALTTFRKAGAAPDTLAAQIAIAHGAVVEPNLEKARELLANIITTCESRSYKWLLAQTLFHRAHLQSNRNSFSQAISDSDRALQIFQKLNDVSGTVRTLIQLASLNLFLNDVETSFAYLKRGLALTDDADVQPGQIWGMHVAVSLNLHILKLYRAALDYQNEASLVIRNSNAALYRSRSYRFVGLTYASLQRFDLAVNNLRLSYEQGRSQAFQRSGQNMMADASLGLGDVYRFAGDTNSALNAYDESLRLYERIGFDHYQYLYAAHKGKFLCYRAQNENAMAARELKIVIELFDQYREKILDERQKNLFFDREQDTYDLAIDFTYSQLGDERRAFDYSETSRARNLRDLMQHGAEVTENDRGLDLRVFKGSVSKKLEPLTADQVQKKLHERLQIVQFAVLEKKLLIWHITRSGIFAESVPIESAQLAELVATARKQIRERDQNGATASLKSLYGFLIEPIKEKLDQDRVLCFVPDETLHYVPFNALISTHNGHYLTQDFRVLVSPSATILIDATENAADRSLKKYEHLLAVGNPAFDRRANPKLEDLPEAQQEVEAIVRTYDSGKVLITHQATKNAIIAHLPKADVAHFAAHYEIDSRSNLLSQLLLAPEPGESAHGAQPSGLMASDIYRMKLKRLKLAILAGCTTGIDQQFSGEGPIGFARSFLVAGVPVVVASLWAVDSDATAKLMIAFHRYRRKNHSSATEALMHAQQELMSQETYRDPYFWAGFVVVGGYADF